MAIGNAVQRGNMVYVFDEKNHQIFSVLGELMGYTTGNVNVKRGNMVYSFDKNNHQVGSQLSS